MVKIADYEKLKGDSVFKVEASKSGQLRIKVVVGVCSISVGAREVLKTVQDTIKEEHIENVIVEITGCVGLCHAEPMIIVHEPCGKEVVYDLVTADKAQIITMVHGLYGKPVLPWVMKNR